MRFLYLLYLLCTVYVSATAPYQARECIKYVLQKFNKMPAPIVRAFFVPYDNVKMLLLGCIYAERTAIKIAAFCITDEDIVEALIAAHRRGVILEIVTDDSCLQVKQNKIKKLQKVGIPVHIYKRAFSIMHHKYCIFFNINGRSFVWTGSANATKAGTTLNLEAVNIIEHPTVIAQYRNNFEDLKKRAKRTYSMPLYTFSTKWIGEVVQSFITTIPS